MFENVIAPPDKLIGVVEPRESKTEAGIIMPGTAGPTSEEFIKIISVGADIKNFEVGQVVAINPYSGKPFFVDRQMFKCFFPQEVYAIIKD